MAKVEIIKPDSLINIQISGYFYSRIQALATYLNKIISQEELTIQINNIKEDKELSEFGSSYETVLILIKELESKAREQKVIESIDLEDN